ncbi:uncharacterized protein LOC124117040 isoform X3 [Haliotis rufescens]|uniref:uncharacterized protein LOC124117040 isoform X3 n=1 Tax=Haliotis rufescens TaxID=6454 RepID=UPI00201F208A|nr:uncharacterized protein LOC124117040 isoform X3 [Haliotis rufescens]
MATAVAPCVCYLLLAYFFHIRLYQHASASQECHCTSGCDGNFRCNGGCLQGWSGPTCQIRNIALNKPTQQSSTISDCWSARTAAKRKVCEYKTSSLAVDGVTSSRYWSGTCTHTATGRPSAWWTVDLGETHLITNLTIFFSNRQRMRGFFVRVDSHLCHQSQYYPPSSPVSISCDTPTSGQRVTVQLPTLTDSKYILNLCEVEIYECADWSFGPGCSSWCYCKNTSEVCDKATGHCESGCVDGSFGPGCNYWCYCRNTSEVCDKATGHCESGCADGYTGTGCQETCSLGRYGQGCMETCGHCDGGDQNCNEVDGTCTRGCQDKWSGTLCKECSDYWFGGRCDRECKCKETYEVCDKKTGQCDSGCEDGRTGLDCQTPCQNGTYGFNCTSRCGRCQGGVPCAKLGGECAKCDPGFMTPLCKQCSNFWFGVRCDRKCKCKDPDEVCVKKTGQCVSGCEDGRTGLDCQTRCSRGRYGFQCGGVCGQCKGGNPRCRRTDGRCKTGCKEKWQGDRCDECRDGHFGVNCTQSCRCLNVTEICDKTTGECRSGCEAGRTGRGCQRLCESGSYGLKCEGRCGQCSGGHKNCSPYNGSCHLGCEGNLGGSRCGECTDRFYGAQCNSRCGQCRGYAICSKTSGDCPDGCEPGWQGMTCHQECHEGRYGDGCSETCGQCAGKCSPVTGTCDQEGCSVGWMGQRCDEACTDGTFGLNCGQPCGQCLAGHVCDKVKGQCQGSRCERGWMGPQCGTACNDTGLYSYNCNETCGMCLGEDCHPITGECSRGCRPKYVGPTCHLREPPNVGGQAGVGVAYAFVFFLIVLLIITLYLLKRRQQRKSTGGVAADAIVNPAFAGEEGVSDENDDDGIYVNVEKTKVKVAELREYIAKREDKFVSEYGRVPRGLIHPHTAAISQEHRAKNRFKAMYPYDHSRVVLQKIPGDKNSDYINANYINTYKRKKAFIATQGPMPKTVGDFWRMVWQEETNIVVMLTRLREGIKVKCEKYWPERNNPLQLADLTITNDGVVERPDYCIRQMIIQHKKLNERRQVMQLHYVTWPDHDVPSTPQLVRFWKVFRSMTADGQAPVVAHCSAGVGRTGTFIGLDAMMERAWQEGVVDVHDFVLKMRADRVSMVQTKEQYLFLHQVVLEALNSDMTHMTPAMFDRRFSTENMASAPEEAILKREWEKLVELKAELAASETEGALLSENTRKNRSKDILPADKCRPILSLPVAGSNDYINAVFVPTETRQKGLLATQLPLPWTVVDFWRMVLDHNVQTIVSLVSEECSSQVDEAHVWPKTDEVLECGPFLVKKTESKDKAIVLRVWLKYAEESTEKDVTLLFVSDWIEGVDTPTNTSQFLCFINDLAARNTSDNIAVMCMDGASKCGLFCAVLNIIQQLKQDQVIDVYLTVRILQTVRPSFLTSYAQYQFCYRMVKEHQKTINSVYENFQR